VLDSQSVKSAKKGAGGADNQVGYDAGKRVKGRKIHALVDSEGLPMRVVVHSAAIQDHDGASVVLDKIRRRFPWLELIWPDGGYNAWQVADCGGKGAAAADDAAARRQALEPYFRNYRRSGAGPFPAILMVSGCSGFTPSIAPQVYTRAAESWRSKGYVVVFVDYLAARRLANCRGSGAVNAVEIGRDVLAVARYLQGQPYVKASQIAAVGWSLGAARCSRHSVN
jgi:Transposase DDE domain